MKDDKETRKRRAVVSGMYPGPKWKSQVEKMPAHRITAIYLRFMRDGAAPKKPEPPKKPPDQLRLDL